MMPIGTQRFAPCHFVYGRIVAHSSTQYERLVRGSAMPRKSREREREQQRKERKRQRVDAPDASAPAQAAPEDAEDEPAPDPALLQLAAEIADQLGETDEEPRETVLRIVLRLGAESALTLLQETQAIEAGGGM